ncbi:MAG: efflux RND transporter periplasmic adaptor subunit, partial [Deltaproteobacteria bacterium]|nr:efflux RND transporter periplasmic adaptor subunit [Deltaproteobacteria bacterium]
NKDIGAQLRLARQEAVAAEVAADEACIMAELASRTAQRFTRLKQKKTVSEASYDEAVTTARARQAACEAGQARHLALLAKVETVQAALDKTILRAPFSGIIAEVNGEAGEFVTPSPPGIATLPAIDLINTETLFVSAPIDEIDAARIMPAMKARITLDAYPDQVFAGTVHRIAPYVLERAKQARTVEVETLFEGNTRPANLLPGYSADVEIIVASQGKVLRVPSEALMEGEQLFILNPETSRLERRSVETGLKNWRFSEVVSGLQPGELVVTSVDRQGLQDGVLVIIENKQ